VKHTVTEWQEIEEGLDGQTVALFKNTVSADEVEIRDTYPNPVSLFKGDRYEVIYDRNNGVPVPGLSGTFKDDENAFEYAVETLMGENLENYHKEDYLE